MLVLAIYSMVCEVGGQEKGDEEQNDAHFFTELIAREGYHVTYIHILLGFGPYIACTYFFADCVVRGRISTICFV